MEKDYEIRLIKQSHDRQTIKTLFSIFVGIATIVGSIIGGIALYDGKNEPGWLGVSVADLDPSMFEALSLSGKTGVYVTHVVKNSAAQDVGFRVGDILLALNGKGIEDTSKFSTQIASIGAGNTIAIAVHRHDGPRTLTPLLKQMPNKKQMSEAYHYELPKNVVFSRKRLKASNFSYARRRTLTFYPNMELWEFGKYGSSCLVSYLVPSKGLPILLTGESTPIHQLNSKIGLQLKDEEVAKEYLIFFSSHVWGEGGSFRIPTNEKEISDYISNNQIIFNPLKLSAKGDIYTAQALVLYSDELFKADFEVQKNGEVHMTNSKQILSGLTRTTSFMNHQRCNVKTEKLKVGNYPLKPVIAGSWSNVPGDKFHKVRLLIISAGL